MARHGILIALIRFWRDFGTYTSEPLHEPLTNRHPNRVNVFASVNRVQQPAQLLFGSPAVALYGGCHSPRPAGFGVPTKAVAQLERSGGTLANVPHSTHFSSSPGAAL